MTVVNPGSSTWQVIADGRPSPSLASNACGAVPAGALDPLLDLTDARGPNTVVWGLSSRNTSGVQVLDVAFGLRWEYGARYGGGGAFIPLCYLYVPRCTVLWGYTVDVSAYVHPPSDVGTGTAPTARLPVTVRGTVRSLLGETPVRWHFVLHGDGRYHCSPPPRD